jgi:nitrilase
MRADAFTAAIVQHPPALLDRDTTMKRVLDRLAEAAGQDARLVVFPETYIPGYPEYVWRMKPGDPHDYALARDLHGRLLASAVDLEADDLAPVREAAARLGLTVTIGIHEREGRFSRASVFNTLVVIGPDGRILNRHRKLVPTNPERMVWAPGDGAGLRVLETPVGRLGVLICWENYMPLARFALYAQGVEVYVAPTWDEGDAWIASMRHIAREGRCWVLGAGCSMQAKDVPEAFPDRARLYPDAEEWLNPGDSVVVAPTGAIVAGPLHRAHGILYARIDPSAAAAAHYTLDPAGHYNRPDVFQLRVDRSLRVPLEFTDGEQAGR